MESLPSVRGARWLVINTMQAGDSGLMLLTSDGRLADALRRRAETIPAAYVARVLVPTPEFDVTTLPLVVNYDDETIEFGLKVSRVIQVKFADIELPRDLPRGRHRALGTDRVAALYALAELELPKVEERPGAKPRKRRPAPDRRATGRRKSGR